MKTYLQINESKSTLRASPVSHIHTHTTHTRTYTPVYPHTCVSYTVFLPCNTQYRRHSKRVVQQRAYKTVSNMAVGWTLALTCIIINTHPHTHTHARTHTPRLLRFMNGVTALMTGLNQHETSSPTGASRPQPHYIRVWFLFSVVTSHNKSFSSCSHQLGPPTWHDPKLSTQISAISGGGEQAWNLARFCEFVRACACVCLYLAWNNEWWHCQLVSNYACYLCFSEGKCALSPSSGEQHEFAITAPREYSCAYLSQSKAGDQIKL